MTRDGQAAPLPPPGRWRRGLAVAGILSVAVCLLVALCDDAARPLAACYRWCRGVREYEARAVIEVPAYTLGPGGVAEEVSSIRQRMLAWRAVREVLASRQVELGAVDPSDDEQLEALYEGITRRTRVEPLGQRHCMVRYRDADRERAARILNGLVKLYVGEDLRLAREKARLEAQTCREKLDAAKAELTEIHNRIRDVSMASPWFREDLAELHRDLRDAEEENNAIGQQITQLEAARSDSQVAGTHKRLERLRARKLASDRKVAELFLMRHKAPELLAQKKRLEEERTRAQDLVNSLARRYRAADKRLAELTRMCRRRGWRVGEYSRVPQGPAGPSTENVAAMQCFAWALAVAILVTVCGGWWTASVVAHRRSAASRAQA